MTRTFEVTAQIENTPEAVLNYIADVRNRPLFLPSLKSVSDIQGEPSATGTMWKWTWLVPGMEFEGIARCLSHEPGRLYSFRSEGGIESTVTYRVQPEGRGTRLTVQVEYAVPKSALPLISSESLLDNLERSEADRAVQNLKAILDQ
jgi:carbon monoxide dehydrogenase subunit G